jgi:hypothetical protein
MLMDFKECSAEPQHKAAFSKDVNWACAIHG